MITTVLCSVSDMKFCDYLIGNIGLIPCDIPVVYIGASMNDLSQAGDSEVNPINLIVMGVGLVVVILIIGIISFYANREMKRSVKAMEDEKKKNEAGNKGKDSKEDSDQDKIEDLPQNVESPNKKKKKDFKAKFFDEENEVRIDPGDIDIQI
jgi:Na+-transporting methylmalonyl-CoA/oxaloacetate decarboxylase gamma subunit